MPTRFYLAPYGPGYIPARPQARASKVISYLGGDDTHATIHAYPYKGWSPVYVDAGLVTHNAIAADTEITLIPFWDGPDPQTANYLTVQDQIRDIAEPHRSSIANFLEARRIPVGWTDGGMMIGRTLRHIIKIYTIAKGLRENYPEYDLETQVRDIPQAKRQAIASWMDDHGIVRSDMTLDWSVRQVLARIVRDYGWSPVMALGVALL